MFQNPVRYVVTLKDSHHSQEISQKTKHWSRLTSFISNCRWNIWCWLNIENFTFKKLDNSNFSSKSNAGTSIPAVHKYSSMDRNLHVCLSYHGLVIPLPEWFLKFIRKNSSGTVYSMESAKLLLKKNAISSNCVLSVDKMYLLKSVQYHSDEFVGKDKEGNLYKGITVFMIVSLRQSVLYVVKSRPEVSRMGWKTCRQDCSKHIF